MIEIDIRDFERRARALDAAADQVPFALANAMNDAARVARAEIVQKTWPAHVHVRNSRFLGVALRTEFANKRKLEVVVYDSLGRASLLQHSRGGQKRARGRLAIPESKNLGAKRSGQGVPKNSRPLALANSFKKGDVLYQRTGPKGRSLKLMYVLKPTAEIKSDVPFQADFERVMQREIARAFGPRIQAAMATRRG